MASNRVLVVRLGSMGDVLHTLPAVATLKHGLPGAEVWWMISRRWAPLIENNPFVDRQVVLDRQGAGRLWEAWRLLRGVRFSLAVDFQGLVQSALLASVARAERVYGFHQSQAREKWAALFYSNRVKASTTHIVDRNLELATAAGASSILRSFHLPEGEPEGQLPPGAYVLASPMAGWAFKQWPLENYSALGRRLRRELGWPLVICGPPEAAPVLSGIPDTHWLPAGLRGLIYATRMAAAVVGVDSGPLHLAAALGKRGVAIYGPTDPERNGPYSSSIIVLRSSSAVTTYKRRRQIAPSMRAISPEAVFQALVAQLGARSAAGHQ